MKNNPANMRGGEKNMVSYNKGGEKIMHISEISRISLVPGGDQKKIEVAGRGAENFPLHREGG